MADDPNAPGTEPAQPTTPEVDGGTGAAPVQDGPAEDMVTIPKAVYDQQLREKSGYEEARRKVAEYEQQLQSRGNGSPPTPDFSQQQQLETRLAEAYNNVQAGVANAEDVSLLMQATIHHQRTLAHETAFRLDLLEVPEATRKEVEDYAKRNRVAPALAKEILEAKHLKEREADIVAREKRLVEQEDAKRRGVVATTAVGVPTHETNDGTMKGSDYQARMARLEKENPTAALDLMRKVERGAIRLVYD